MAQLGETFDTKTLPQGKTQDFTPIPAGWYTVSINNAELKKTKAGTGEYIAVRYDITGPSHQGRVVFGNLNIRNPNPKAEEIGRQQLNDLMRSIGLKTVQDTDQLVGGVLSIKIDVRSDEKYGDSNDVKAFRAIEGAVAAPVSTPKTTASKASPPWVKK